jgi:hypothetical protein
MTTVRHQIAKLQPKRFALCFFPLDDSLESCKTSLIKQGAAQEGTMVRLYWDKKNPDLPAKVVYVEGTCCYCICIIVLPLHSNTFHTKTLSGF